MTDREPKLSFPIEASELRGCDPLWADQYLKACSNPWENGIIPVKTIELICVGLCAACTNMQEGPTRRHIKAALRAGATREEILMILKMGSVMCIHSLSLGAPILLDEAKEAGITLSVKTASTPSCDKMREIGQWNNVWDPFYDLDPLFTDEFMACGLGIYAAGLLSAKDVELLSIAFDASITHMYAPGTRRHIKNALKAGATVEEVMEVLKVCVAFGIEACDLGTRILVEELANLEK
jgi:alkylhydroperoxidase/carboxymuconolactone decarboxylase family protein YurZ